MDILIRWRPYKLEEHGKQDVLAARNLLETHGAKFSRENREVAEGLLEKWVKPFCANAAV